jgi:hypothetical protein
MRTNRLPKRSVFPEWGIVRLGGVNVATLF